MTEDPRHRYYELSVAEVIQETVDARSFVFEIPPDLRNLFVYRAGQFLTFQIPWRGMQLKRCYSLASSPELVERPKVTVKRVQDGRVSNWFNDELSPGDRIRVLPPEGRFVLRPSDRPIALLSGGSGITPVISILKSALATTRRCLKLIYANQDADSIIFGTELDALAARCAPRLELIHHLDVESGLLDVQALIDHLSGWEHADFYVCGPEAFMDRVEAALEKIGVQRSRIFIERFVSPTDPDRAPPQTAPPVAQVSGRASVRLDGATHEVPYEAGETLLEAIRRAGLDPPFACEEGYCSTCMAHLDRGQVHMRTNDALTERDLADGFVLTCQSVPLTGECAVDYDAEAAG